LGQCACQEKQEPINVQHFILYGNNIEGGQDDASLNFLPLGANYNVLEQVNYTLEEVNGFSVLAFNLVAQGIDRVS
jgi:hypothetical protein